MKQLGILFVLVLLSLNIMAQFTPEELNIIRDGKKENPFRVLLTTDKQDSLILRSKSEDVDSIVGNKDLKRLVHRLLTTMNKEGGVGIAAPQVGVLKNVFLFARIDRDDDSVSVAINPRIVNHADALVCFDGDGCLSVPNESNKSQRYPWVEVEYTTLAGKVIRERLEGYSRETDFTGVIFQHEYDHLRGVLFIDKIWKEEE